MLDARHLLPLIQLGLYRIDQQSGIGVSDTCKGPLSIGPGQG